MKYAKAREGKKPTNGQPKERCIRVIKIGSSDNIATEADLALACEGLKNSVLVVRHNLPVKFEKVDFGKDKVMVVMVGSDDHPATQKDVEDVVRNIKRCADDPSMTFVTHHAVDIEVHGDM